MQSKRGSLPKSQYVAPSQAESVLASVLLLHQTSSSEKIGNEADGTYPRSISSE